MIYKNIDVQDNLYEEYLADCPEVPSDCTRSIIFGYAEAQQITRGYSHGLCWQKGVYFDGTPFYFPPIGNWNEANWTAIGKDILKKGMVFLYVPKSLMEIMVKQYPNCFAVEDCRNEYDYLYSVEQFINAKGTKYRNIRNHRYHFETAYSFEISDTALEEASDLLAFESKFFNCYIANNANYANDAEFLAEHDAFKKIMKDYRYHNLKGFSMKINHEIVGFAVCEIVDTSTATVLFLKADNQYSGIVNYLEFIVAKKLYALGIKTLNYMADVGVEGLRFNKLKKNPSGFIEKCRMEIIEDIETVLF